MANSIRPGDAVFIRSGLPAIVQEKDDINGRLTLDQDLGDVKTQMRHGYLNGVKPETRKQLYDILDGVKGETKDPQQRAEQLQRKIDELEVDPHNLDLVRYLRAEMVHIMNTYGLKPKTYSISESKAR